MNNNTIMTSEYKLEWTDHLFEVYSDFRRRNNISEWVYFFNRPELANKKEHDDIARVTMNCILQNPNISKKAVTLIEEKLRFLDEIRKYENIFGYENMETYKSMLLGGLEFPPIDMFENTEEEKDYDGFMFALRDMYFGGAAFGDEQKYTEMLKSISETGIKHPYVSLIVAEHHIKRGEFAYALEELKKLPEDDYYRNLSVGLVCMETSAYEDAEYFFQSAISQNTGRLDDLLISSFLMAKWHQLKYKEAYECAVGFIEHGYESLVVPIKNQMLAALSEIIAEKVESYELTEDDYFMVFEYYRSVGDTENALVLGEYALKNKFKGGRWIVSMAEFYYECERIDDVQRLIEEAYSQTIDISTTERNKIKTLKAGIFFSQGRIEDAYELMESMYYSEDCRNYQRIFMGEMCAATGRLIEAGKIYDYLSSQSPGQPVYLFELAKVLLNMDENESAYKILKSMYEHNAEEKGYLEDVGEVAFYMVQAAIDMGDLNAAKKAFEKASGVISEIKGRFLNGQICELKEEYEKAKIIYKEITLEYPKNQENDKTIQDAYLRYFIMRATLNGRVLPMINEIKKALMQNPDNANLWMFMGDLYADSGFKEEEAGKCYKTAHEKDPFNIEVLTKLIQVYLDEDNQNKAWECESEYVLYTDSKEAYLARIYYGLEIGKNTVESDLQKYIERGGDEKESYQLKAQIHLTKGEYENAMFCYEEAMKNRTSAATQHYGDMALCLCKLGRIDEAYDLLKRACRNGNNASALGRVLQIELYLGKFKEARNTVKMIKEAYNAGAFDDGITYANANAVMESGNIVMAKAIAQTIASADGEQLCGIMETIQKNYSAALRIFRKLIMKKPEEIDNYSYAALAAALKKNQELATEYAEKGLEILRENNFDEEEIKKPSVLCQFGILHALAGDMERSMKFFNRAVSLPTCCEYICTECYEAYYGMGITYAYYGQKEEAGRAFNKSIEIKEHNIVCKKIGGNILRRN